MESQKIQSTESNEEKGGNNLPQIPQEFIQLYIKRYNEGKKIEKVLVEYVDYDVKGRITSEEHVDNLGKYHLKLNGNEIIISEIEEKLYTREEVRHIAKKFLTVGMNGDVSSSFEDIFNRLMD